MGTTAQKLQAILTAKTAIKTAVAKFKSNIGDKLSDYAPVISTMADRANDFGDFVGGVRSDSITIPLPTSGSTSLRPYLCYTLKTNDLYVEKGFTTVSQRVFQALNSGGSATCYVHLPNTITSFSSSYAWTNSNQVIPILEDGWQASFTIAGITHNGITQSVLENMIDALADLTGETGQTLTLANQTQYDLISAEKLASATAKNWTVTY